MPKTTPTITTYQVSINTAAQDVRTLLTEGSHKSHKLTRVGTFKDSSGLDGRTPQNEHYEVWYCRDDHQVFVI